MYDFYTTLKFSELLDLRAYTCFLNAPYFTEANNVCICILNLNQARRKFQGSHWWKNLFFTPVAQTGPHLAVMSQDPYLQTSNISLTKSQSLNVSGLILQLSAQSIKARC